MEFQLRRLKNALDLKPFMAEAEQILNRGCDSEDSELENEFDKRPTYEEKELMYNYNAENDNDERKWLYNLLLSDTESDSEEISDEDQYVGEMLKDHVTEKKYRAKYHENPNVSMLIHEYICQ